MTDNRLRRILVLLAAAGITPQEFKLFASAMRDLEADDLHVVYNRLRNRLRHLEPVEPSLFDNQVEASPRQTTTIKDIVALAKHANVRPADAASKIREELSRRGLNVDRTAYSAREGFSRWLDRMSRQVGHTALLNAAIAVLTDDPNSNQQWRLSSP